MSLKSDKLTKRIQGIQQFLANKVDLHTIYKTVSKNLINIAAIQNNKKLTLQIISANVEAANNLQTQLKKSEILAETCAIQIASLPQKIEQPEPKKTSILKLETLGENTGEIQTITYPVSEQGILKIGRDPSNDILIPVNHTLVSRFHGEIVITSSSEKLHTLQLEFKNNKSRYGIYYNQEKIDNVILKAGDCITLGHPHLTSKNAAITFDYEVEKVVQDDVFNWELVNCDILCLILEANHSLNSQEIWLLKKTQQAQIHKQFIIVEIPNNTPEIVQQMETNIDEIKSKLYSVLPTFNSEIISLSLTNFTSEPEPTKIETKLSKQIKQFPQSLERVVKMRPEDILSKRLDYLVDQEVQKINDVLEDQKTEIMQQIKKLELQTKQTNSTDFKDSLKTAIGEIKEKKNRFFKLAKDEINQSKSNLLSQFNHEGLSVKLKNFIDNLYPMITYQDNLCIVQLHNTEQDVHEAVIKLLQTELNFWALEEWQKIHTVYGKGGFENLIYQSQQCLKVIVSSSDNHNFLYLPETIKVQQKSSNSVPEPNLGKQDKQPSLPGYILHKIRHNVTSVGMVLMIIAGGVSGGFSFAAEHIFPSLLDLKSAQEEPGKQSSTRGNPRNLLYFLMIPALLPFTYRDYKKDKVKNSEKITQQLKDELSKYYESFIKEHTDNITKILLLNLEEIDYQFTKSLEQVEDKYKNHLTHLEKNKEAHKMIISQYNQSLRKLDLAIKEISRL